MARPKTGKYDNVANELDEYVDETEIPILAEFCYKNNYRKEWLYRMAKNDEELDTSIKRCMAKKESVLEIGALKGELNSTMAIFSLKQMGWRDKVEVEADVDSNVTGIIEMPPVVTNE